MSEPVGRNEWEEETPFRPHQTSLCEGGSRSVRRKIKEHGVVTHELSGGIDTESSEPFDKLKIAVKRGESGTQAWHLVKHRESGQESL